jgi:hypothetical protein
VSKIDIDSSSTKFDRNLQRKLRNTKQRQKYSQNKSKNTKKLVDSSRKQNTDVTTNNSNKEPTASDNTTTNDSKQTKGVFLCWHLSFLLSILKIAKEINGNNKRRRKDREEADDLQLAPTTRRIQASFVPSLFPPFPITKNSQPRRLRTIIITTSTTTKCKKKASNEEPGTKTSSSTSSWFTGTAASKSG